MVYDKFGKPFNIVSSILRNTPIQMRITNYCQKVAVIPTGSWLFVFWPKNLYLRQIHSFKSFNQDDIHYAQQRHQLKWVVIVINIHHHADLSL